MAANYNAVIRHYRTCSDVLKRELGTVPEPATTALYQEARTRLKDAPPPSPAAIPADRHPMSDEKQDIRFCVTADGVRIAFASAGKGPPLVKCANWLNHLEFDWQSPVWRHLLRELSSEFRLIRYDERGNGLSDWKVDDFSYEAHGARPGERGRCSRARPLSTAGDFAGLRGRHRLCGAPSRARDTHGAAWRLCQGLARARQSVRDRQARSDADPGARRLGPGESGISRRSSPPGTFRTAARSSGAGGTTCSGSRPRRRMRSG